jgi:CII-binding regulator of phage lambda lysogenization HflD
MAELVGIVASAGSIIKAIGSVVVLINGISNANHEARQLTGHLDATKQILTALTATLSTVPQSSEFLDVWSGSAKTVLTNVKSLVSQLETKLDAKSSQQNRVRLSTWKKMKWPFVKEEYLELQQMLGAYIMMLAMVQNAFMQ